MFPASSTRCWTANAINAQLAKLEFLSSYRFTIAFENTSVDGYVTEKIVHPLIAGSIPVYWGSPDVAERYNPDAFINCHDFGSFEEVIERILEIDADPPRLEAMRRAPMLHTDSCIPDLHRDLDVRWRQLTETAINRRSLILTPAERRRRWTALARRSIAIVRDRNAEKSLLRALTLLLGETTNVHGVRYMIPSSATGEPPSASSLPTNLACSWLPEAFRSPIRTRMGGILSAAVGVRVHPFRRRPHQSQSPNRDHCEFDRLSHAAAYKTPCRTPPAAYVPGKEPDDRRHEVLLPEVASRPRECLDNRRRVPLDLLFDLVEQVVVRGARTRWLDNLHQLRKVGIPDHFKVRCKRRPEIGVTLVGQEKDAIAFARMPSPRRRRRMLSGRINHLIGPQSRSPRRMCTAAYPAGQRFRSVSTTGLAWRSTDADGQNRKTGVFVKRTSRRNTWCRT